MVELLLERNGDLYTLAFFGSAAIVALWEWYQPRRRESALIRRRWGGNFGIAAVTVGVIHLIVPVAAVGFALIVEACGLGLTRLIGAPEWLAIAVGALALDLGRYWHHTLLHRLPVLWRAHRVHHADLDYDFTVGLRFHPFEGLFSVAFVFAVIALVGVPPIVVLAVEIAVVVTGMIIHANARTPRWVERHVRLVFVTPDMHRIHHSVDEGEHNSNYGAVLSIWDRLFGTYVAEPALPHETMPMGLPDTRDPVCLNLIWMLVEPFKPRPHRGGAVSAEPQPTAQRP